jgi:ADP-ribose pyrophosphatase YjhB (NUDIX family)
MSSIFSSVGVLIEWRGLFLLCKRTPFAQNLPNFWSVPAGHLEQDELPEVGAARELYEETRIALDPEELELFCSINDFALFYYNSPFMYYPILDVEHVGYAYFSGAEAIQLRDIDEELALTIRKLLTNK